MVDHCMIRDLLDARAALMHDKAPCSWRGGTNASADTMVVADRSTYFIITSTIIKRQPRHLHLLWVEILPLVFTDSEIGRTSLVYGADRQWGLSPSRPVLHRSEDTNIGGTAGELNNDCMVVLCGVSRAPDIIFLLFIF